MTSGNKRFVQIEGGATHYLSEFEVVRLVEADPDAGGRGESIELKAVGFKNGTTVTFFRHNGDAEDSIGANRETLCSAQVQSDDVGSCKVTVTAPLFQRSDNFINAVDGRSKTAPAERELQPGTGRGDNSRVGQPRRKHPGPVVRLQAAGASVTKVEIARQALYQHDTEPVKLFATAAAAAAADYTLWTPGGRATATGGELNFSLVVPNQAPGGVQDFRVTADDEDASTKIAIGGPVVTVNPTTVIANQRISLVGNGFNPGSDITSITFGGDTIPADDINDSDDVNVDSSGNWSAAVDLPLATSTVAPGTHTIKVSRQWRAHRRGPGNRAATLGNHHPGRWPGGNPGRGPRGELPRQERQRHAGQHPHRL